jgi:DNA-3-methyladenine glycosylase
MPSRLPEAFYAGDTRDVAQALLGKYLVHATEAGRFAGRLVETEAYHGHDDLASHASRGRTARTAVMFGPPGRWYVYLIYGVYHCLNVVTGPEDYPSAVLIRGVDNTTGIPAGVKTDGPGKLCRAFGIDKRLNTAPAFGRAATLWIEDRGELIAPEQIRATPRIGVDYAGDYKGKPWRYLLKQEETRLKKQDPRNR